MTEVIKNLSDIGTIEDTADEEKNIVVLSSYDELLSFILDILDFGENIESEEILEHNNSYRVLSDLLRKLNTITIIVEQKYVDQVYRDSYYMHFSCKHGKYSRFCKRLFLFSGNVFEDEPEKDFADLDAKKLQKKFIGTVVMRPLKEGKVGRTLINPHFIIGSDKNFLRYAQYSVTIYGIKLYINAFPFSMQDGETTTCAEITILNLMDYFSRKYPNYKSILPSEISKIAEENGYERNLPTKGLGYAVITKVFSEMGFSPRLYNTDLLADMSQFKRVMHYYIESGIPVAVGVKIEKNMRHSIVCVGHGMIQYDKIKENIYAKIYAVHDAIADDYIWIADSADLCNHYIMMDDGRCPYEINEWQSAPQGEKLLGKSMLGNYEPDTLMVPLYKRMNLEAQDAYDICTSALASSKIGIKAFRPDLGKKNSPVIIRLFMCSSKNYKQRRVSNFTSQNSEIRERYVELFLPRFVWVCELYDGAGYCDGKALGEIVIDATASPHDGIKSILLFHYPYFILVCKRNIKSHFDRNQEFVQLRNWEPFAGYDHNLFPSEKIKQNEYNNYLGE